MGSYDILAFRVAMWATQGAFALVLVPIVIVTMGPGLGGNFLLGWILVGCGRSLIVLNVLDSAVLISIRPRLPIMQLLYKIAVNCVLLVAIWIGVSNFT